MSADHDPLWARYAETVLHFAVVPPIRVDLRVLVAPPVRAGLRAIGVSGQFAVVTAYNPRGQNLSEEENSRRSAQLESELESLHERFVCVDACSPDRAHCEWSVALAVTRERAIEIAKRYEQVAIFWFDGGEFWIEPVLSKHNKTRLPLGSDTHLAASPPTR